MLTRLRQLRSACGSAPALVTWCSPLAQNPSTHCYTSSSSNEDSHPVIIAGAGPSGLTLALWLSRYGVRSLVLERASQLSTHPQAHYINNRTMEVLRPLDGLAADVAAATPPLSHWRTFRYCFSMVGELLGEVDHFKGQNSPHNASVSPEPVAHVPQSRLLPLMMSRVTQPNSLVTLLWGSTVTACAATRDGVTVTVKDAQGRQKQLTGSFLAAADGAHSVIRQQLGIGMAGDQAMQHLINIHFTCPSLGNQLLGPLTNSASNTSSNFSSASTSGSNSSSSGGSGSRPTPGSQASAAAMLYFVFNRDVVGVVVAHDLRLGEFVAQVPYFPPLQSPADFPEAECRRLVAGAAGLDLAHMHDLKIHQVRPWVMSAVVADRFQYAPDDSQASRPPHPNSQPLHPNSQPPPPTPRIFLLGDSAHRFPPAGGFGMNTGIQDAHNLAWKLALVIRRQGQEPGGILSQGRVRQELVHAGHLLSSYEAERRPVASVNCALSVRNWQEAVGVPSKLGLDPRAAAVLDTAVRAVPLPSSASKALLEAGLALGRAVTTSWTPIRPWQMARVKQVFDSGVTLRLQFPREDLGFSYDTPGAAVVHSGPAATPPRQQSTPERGLRYEPSSEIGCRMPHLWLSEGLEPHQQQGRQEGQQLRTPPGRHHRQAGTSTDTWQQDSRAGVGSVNSGWVSTLDVVAGALLAPKAAEESRSQASADLHVAAAALQGYGPVLTLFVDDLGGSENAWLRAACALQQHQHACGQDLPLQVVQVVRKGVHGPMGEGWRVLQDVHRVWHDTMRLQHGGALLVRPDGHVAWRSVSAPPTDKEGSIEAAGNMQARASHDSSMSAATRLLHGAVLAVLKGL